MVDPHFHAPKLGEHFDTGIRMLRLSSLRFRRDGVEGFSAKEVGSDSAVKLAAYEKRTGCHCCRVDPSMGCIYRDPNLKYSHLNMSPDGYAWFLG